MEQKKLFFVLVSVGVFLVVLLGVGIWVFKPLPKPQTSAAAPASSAPAAAPASADPAEWVRNPKAVPGLQPAAAGSGSTRGDVIIIYGERPNGAAPSVPGGSTPNAAVSADGSLKVDVSVPQAQPQAAPPVPAPQPAANDAQVQTAAKTAPAAKAPKETAVKAAPAVKKPTAVTKKDAKKSDEFWIQTGSFAAKARADSAKDTLSAKGISSLVETKEISGKTYFRVRVGPYSSKNEADYWLSLVKTIDGFDHSYVSQLKTNR